MATLEDEEEAAVPGTCPADPGGQAAAPDLPTGDLASRPAPEQGLGVDGLPVSPPAKAPRKVKLTRPDREPLEKDQNEIVTGNPPAPPLTAAEGGLSQNEEDIAGWRMRDPKMTIAEIGHMTRLPNKTVKRALEQPAVKRYMSVYLNAAGAKLEESARVIFEAHNAKKVTRPSYMGKFGDAVEDIDHGTRLEAAKLNMQAQGALEEKGTELSQYQNFTDCQIQLIITGQARPEDFLGEVLPP